MEAATRVIHLPTVKSLHYLIGTMLVMLMTSCSSLSPFHGHREPLETLQLGTASGWSGFRNPSQSDPPQLVLLRPYQPGKIPIVFIHGLLSSPKTWSEMIAGIQEDPELSARYQFWIFRYPTGLSYLKSASDLRTQLISTVRQLDPQQKDPALFEMVLIGHSMGGLIAKLQISRSDGELWNAVSTQPLETFQIDPETKQKLSEILWFEPLPFVRRVVLIATPHTGSTMSNGRLGQLGRSLVEVPQEMRREYDQLVNGNLEFLRIRPSGDFPTSIDYLAANHPVLNAICHLERSDEVHVHSIVGVGRRLPDGSWGDGVVSTDSAYLSGVESEFRIRAHHMKIHQTNEAIAETKRILWLHLWRISVSRSPTLDLRSDHPR